MERIKITGEVEISSKKLAAVQAKVTNVAEFKKKIEEFLNASATDLLEIILLGAISLDISDVHIEAEEEKARLRIRIDGVLHNVIILEEKNYQIILSRIKLISGLKFNITDRPQDGRFTILFSQGLAIEIRTSTLPAEYGEAIVLRLLNPKNLIKVEELGLRNDLIDVLEKEIKRPNGMIIVTGPTGSGKTTTLYAILKKINKPQVKIITVEDPVEYRLEGLSQTQVDAKKGYTFASGLRSIMRQDPDVILVGEIRDLETAEIACQAALTGHLVFSTLHTNDAAGAIARLVDLGVRPVSIAPAINMIVAQRLLRRVCKKCAQLVVPDPAVLKKIKKELSGLKKDILPPSFFDPKLKIFQTKGCQDCNNTGYRGRVGIYEALLIDNEMEKFILTNPSIVDMRDLAIKKGMLLMRQDGLIKVLQGITTIEEIERMVGE